MSLAILLLGFARDLFHLQIHTLYSLWIDAIAQLLIELKLDQAIADQHAEDALITIQGAFILAQALHNPAPFQRSIPSHPAFLLTPSIRL